MGGAQDAGEVGEVPLEQGDGLVESAGGLVGAGEVAARGEGVKVVGTRETGEVGEVLLEQTDSFVEPARFPVGAGEMVA